MKATQEHIDNAIKELEQAKRKLFEDEYNKKKEQAKEAREYFCKIVPKPEKWIINSFHNHILHPDIETIQCGYNEPSMHGDYMETAGMLYLFDTKRKAIIGNAGSGGTCVICPDCPYLADEIKGNIGWVQNGTDPRMNEAIKQFIESL